MEDEVQYLYLDELALQVMLNVIADGWLLRATAHALGLFTSRIRLFFSALTGSAYYVIYRLSLLGLLWPGIPWRSLPVIILAGIAMLAIAFAPFSGRRFVQICATFFLLAIVAAGMAITVAYLLGDPGAPHWTAGSVAFLVAVPTLASRVWGALHRHAWRRLYQLQVTISLAGKAVNLPALLDTGNQLRDPVMGRPVLICDSGAARLLLPPVLWRALVSLDRGELTAATALENPELEGRLCPVPFSSLGQDRGILWALRPDRVLVRTVEGIYENRACLVAFLPHRLDKDGIYQALVPGALLSPASRTGLSQAVDPFTPAQGGGKSGHASASPA
ncbi:MAG: sigma-E processing peptidase SpoIIGA [Limnochordales bacterium]|nr:sigma-E processing peptidase SpoIIGA [Limnochordales bacterium]